MQTRTGILLVNLGTPDSPHAKDVRKYLIEFLTDGRVLDMPWLSRQLLVRGVIVPRRYRESAKGYRKIWTKLGSPLLFHGRNLQKALQDKLGHDFVVELAMRYRRPSIEQGIQALIHRQVSTIVILPLFPQYASATTGSVQQKVMEVLQGCTVIPKLVFIDHFGLRADVIDSFCSVVDKQALMESDLVLFSFHGLPKKHLTAINPACFGCTECCATLHAKNSSCYSAQCHTMAHAIADQLGIPAKKYRICFQSRLGKEPWLEPYTSDLIAQAAKNGHKKLLLFSPSFVCDCLETLYEIEIECTHAFAQAGGEKLTLVPGLNTHPRWIDALSSIVLDHHFQGRIKPS